MCFRNIEYTLRGQEKWEPLGLQSDKVIALIFIGQSIWKGPIREECSMNSFKPTFLIKTSRETQQVKPRHI